MDNRLEGKVAFVTGASRGQGRAHALRLAREGADIVGVALHSPDESQAFKETIALVEETGRRMIGRAADVRRLDELEAAVAEGMDTFGRLDVVVANAGVITTGSALATTEEDWRRTFDVNVLGAWLTCKAAAPRIIEGARGGSIVLVGAVSGLRGTAMAAAYAASKHAVVGLAASLAQELGPHGIRVNSVHPSGVGVPARPEAVPEATWDALLEQRSAVHLLKVPAVDQEDVAAAAAFLASDDARFLTGVAMPVDAGFLAK